MKIEAIDAVFPSRRVSNGEVLDLIRHHSHGHFQGDLDETLQRIERGLAHSGAAERRWAADGERPIDFITRAVHGALRKAQVTPDEVDLLIYVGVGKGFMEPGQSYLVAHALGWTRTECFDILDACMSYTRALQMAESLLSLGRYRRVLVVNGELLAGVAGGPVFPANFRLTSAAQLKSTFPSFTIGCAATATLLVADPERRWRWRFASRPLLADLCTIPSAGWADYAAASPRTGANGIYRFTSFGKELHEAAREPLLQLFHEVVEDPAAVKLIFSHASSLREWEGFAEAVGMRDRLCCVYRDYGNLVSASVPAALALAIEGGRVQRGDSLLGWVGSAGMSFAAYSFTY